MRNSTLLFVNEKTKSFDFSPWGGLEGFLRASQASSARNLKPFVVWLARGVSMTSLAVSSLPFDIYGENEQVIDSSKDWKNILGGIPSPRTLLYKLAASLCGGSAYLVPEATNRLIVDLHYCAPHTIQPYYNQIGIQNFTRNTDLGTAETLNPEEIIYFWLPDSDVEVGPALCHPLKNASIAAKQLLSINSALTTYGDNGFVPATLVGVEGMVSEVERKKTEAWLNQFFRRALTTLTKLINAKRMDIQVVGAKMDELKGVYSEIYTQCVEDIGAAFGIPAALFMSDRAYATEIDQLTRQWYETSVFTSLWQCIEDTFNSQLLNRYNARWKFNVEALAAFQTDDKTKMERWQILTGKGVKNSLAAKIVGLDLPEDVKYEELDPEEKEPEPPVVSSELSPSLEVEKEETEEENVPKTPRLTSEQTKDLHLWHSNALRHFRKGQGKDIDWECKALPDEIADRIREKLKVAETVEEIDKAFEIQITEKSDDEALNVLQGLREAVDVYYKTVPSQQVFHIAPPTVSVTAHLPEGKSETVFAPVIQPAEVINKIEVTPTPITVENNVEVKTPKIKRTVSQIERDKKQNIDGQTVDYEYEE